MVDALRRLAEQAAAFLLPPACPVCAAFVPAPNPGGVCGRCWSGVGSLPSPRCGRCDSSLGTGAEAGSGGCATCQRWPPALSRVRAAVRYDGPARALVHRLKYGGWSGLAVPMAGLMRRSLDAVGPGVLVPVPTTASRKRLRGYNQAALLAAELARQTARKARHDWLRRPSARSQIGLPAHKRWANLRGAFALTEAGRSEVRGTRVVLVDDVLTTGSTATAAARALVDAGASWVGLVTFARAQPDHRAVSGRA